MRGPAPKPSHLRQRRNKKAGHAGLSGVRPRAGRVPELFDRPCPCGGAVDKPMPQAKRKVGRPKKERPVCDACQGTGTLPWHVLTLSWWRDVWTSEVCNQYLQVDRHGLYRLAVMVDRYWHASDAGMPIQALGAEIRLQQQAYGNTPLDRTRLQWEIERPEDKPAAADEPPPVYDSRTVLRALK